jgi:hypothetical protein
MSAYARLNERIAVSEDWAIMVRDDRLAAIIYVMSWPACNVYGVVVGSLFSFRAKVCPSLGLTDKALQKALDYLESHGFFVPFFDEERRYYWLPSWARQNDVRWDNVGPPDLPLPQCWEIPSGLREVLECDRDTEKIGRLRRYFMRNGFAALWSGPVPAQSQNGDGTDSEQIRNGSKIPPSPSPSPSPSPAPAPEKRLDPSGPAPPTGVAPPQRLSLEVPEPEKRVKKETVQQAAIRSVYEAYGISGTPGGEGYSRLTKLVNQHTAGAFERWAAIVRGAPPPLPETDPWPWFVEEVADAMKTRWQWDPAKMDKTRRPNMGLQPIETGTVEVNEHGEQI